MHDLLIKVFVKDYKNIDDTSVRSEYGRFSAAFGIITNILLFIIKISLGLWFSSISILADAYNNLIDSVSSIITLIGFKLAAKPADKEHPFGHARYESISGLLVGIIVVYFGVEFIKASINKVFNPSSVLLSAPMLILLLISIAIKFWQYSFNGYVGDKINSNVILATAIDSRNDMFITFLVLVGVVFEYFFYIKIDGYIGLILAIFIIISGVTMVKNTTSELLGKRPTNKKIKAIEDLLDSYDNILGFHDLIVHQYGHNQYFATVHAEVDSKMSLIQTHDIVDKIEDDFLEKLNINMVIHQDPVFLDDPIRTSYHVKIKEILNNFNQDYSFHDFRLIKHHSYNKILFNLVVNWEEKRSDNEIIDQVKARILEEFDNLKIEITIDRNYLETRSLDAEKTN